MKPAFALKALLLLLAVAVPAFAAGQEPARSKLVLQDPNPRHYQLTARASELDPRVKAHPVDKVGKATGMDEGCDKDQS